ncbi:MAG: acetyl-CoA C-acyltransferase [Pseudomonadota bacterium]|nr:acetyl-CoA C-acyltransferase [Pseudomonadota bacterium]
MTDREIVLLSARRTPIGALQGALASVDAATLGATAIAAALGDAGLAPTQLGEVFMGCVLPAGVGQAPARMAALAAGVPNSVGAVTVNKVCGSGMRTVMLAHDLIRAGSARYLLAGGMESMSNAPYLLPRARGGYRLGHGELLDHMLYDGLEDPAGHRPMGAFAEATAERYGCSREAQDDFARVSLERARRAIAEDAFAAELVPVAVTVRREQRTVVQDEEPGRADPARIPSLRPVFAREGTVTAASSSSIADGAAALVVADGDQARADGLTPLARIVGQSVFAQTPEWFTTSPVGAIDRLLEQIGWQVADVDLFEINEAFAVVTMAAMQELDLPHEKVNVNGGACALGHPIGASGARILVTLLHALQARGLRRGVAALCIGGGEATAIAIERL